MSNAPTSTRSYVGFVPVMNVRPEDVTIGGTALFAMLTIGPVEFYMGSPEPMGAAKRREELETIHQIGAAIVAQAATALGMDPSAGHTDRDLAELRDAGVDPASTQPRERAVECIVCRKRTFHQMGYCDRHYVAPDAVRRALPVA